MTKVGRRSCRSVLLSVPSTKASEAAKEPQELADPRRHGHRGQAKHCPSSGSLGVLSQPETAAADAEPPRHPGIALRAARPRAGRREQLKLAVPSRRLPERQQRVRPFVFALSPARERTRDKGLARAVEPSLLALQPDENLLLPAFLNSLDPQRREVDGHSVLEAWAEERVHVRMSRSALAAVLVDGENALGASGAAAEGLLDGVTQNALGEMTVQPVEALGRGVVHGENEAEVDGIPEADC